MHIETPLSNHGWLATCRDLPPGRDESAVWAGEARPDERGFAKGQEEDSRSSSETGGRAGLSSVGALVGSAEAASQRQQVAVRICPGSA